MRGRIEHRRHEYTLAMYGAWRNEAFHRADRLQPYSSYLPGKAPEKVHTVEQRLAQIRSQRFGDSAPTITRIG